MKIEVDILELLLPNLLTLVTQLCAPFLLFILLKKLAWNPVRKILETRAAYEQGKLEEADRKNAEAEELRKEAEDNISKAQAEARQIVEDSRVEGEKAKEKLLEEAREETEQMTELVTKGMTEAMTLDVPLTVECSVGSDWYEAK